MFSRVLVMVSSEPHSLLGFALLLRTVRDFVRGLCAFRITGPHVTVFGSARIGPEADVYGTAVSLGSALSDAGFTVMTGGGPGMMEAVSRGVKVAGGRALACRVTFSFEQARNAYLDRCVTFQYFFVRKVMLCRNACAFVALPGGLGTLDELFEVLTLIQTKKIRPVPVVLVGTRFWEPMLAVLKRMSREGLLLETDLDVLYVTDAVDDAIGYIRTRCLEIGECETRADATSRREAPCAKDYVGTAVFGEKARSLWR